MKQLIKISLIPFPSALAFNGSMLFLRIAASCQIAIVHGFKKIGIGVSRAESIPNPLNLPDLINNWFAIGANIVFPFFVLIGLFTRLASIPTLAVTITGYFMVHWNDKIKQDTPFIYSLLFLMILMLGPGKYSIDNYLHKKYHRKSI